VNCNDTRDPQNFSKVSILVYMCESGKSDSLVYISENNFHANTTQFTEVTIIVHAPLYMLYKLSIH